VSAGEVAQLITSIATLIGVLRVTRKVQEVHKATNSIVTQLVETTKTEAFAAGQQDQKDKQG
jgi:hypothetical protein